MELTFERDNLLYSLQVLQGVASGRSTLPILSNVLIQATDGKIACIATDLEIGIKIRVEGVIQEAGATTVSARKLADVIKELPEGKTIHLATTANDRVEITCGNGVYTIIGLPDEEFPQLPSVDGESLTIDGDTLRTLLRKTEFAASTEEVRYFLNGVYFNFLADRTEVVATDSRSLALAHCAPLKPAGNDGFILPLKAVKEITRAFAEASEVTLSIFENQILFADENVTLTTRLVEGDYPKYDKLIPKDTTGRAVVAKEIILPAVRRVGLLSNPKNHSITLDMEEEQITIYAKTPEMGEAREKISVQSCTATARFAIDARLLKNTLAHIETESLAIEFTGEFAPVVIRPVGDEGHTCLVMPMRSEF